MFNESCGSSANFFFRTPFSLIYIIITFFCNLRYIYIEYIFYITLTDINTIDSDFVLLLLIKLPREKKKLNNNYIKYTTLLIKKSKKKVVKFLRSN